jgi:hypothetical protein
VRDRARPHHVVYAVGDVAIEVSVTREPGSQTVVVGQLSERADHRRPLANRLVLLWDGEDVVARTLTNRWGEFHLQHLALGRLHLGVGDGETAARVPLWRPDQTRAGRS